MKRHSWRTTLWAVLVAVALAAAACGDDDDGGGQAADDDPVRGGTLTSTR
jgi:hypothetical protein